MGFVTVTFVRVTLCTTALGLTLCGGRTVAEELLVEETGATVAMGLLVADIGTTTLEVGTTEEIGTTAAVELLFTGTGTMTAV